MIVPYDTFTDEDLFDALKKEDEAAFTLLYNRYHKAVYRYLLAQVKSPELAQDILHEVFLKIWEIRHSLVLKVSFSAYLFRICRNKVVDALRRVTADQALRSELLAHYETLVDTPALSQVELGRMDNLVEAALESLTPQRRAVYQLCRLQGKSYRQAAEELGISHNTVKEHMGRALAGLRGYIQEHGELAIIVCFIQLHR